MEVKESIRADKKEELIKLFESSEYDDYHEWLEDTMLNVLCEIEHKRKVFSRRIREKSMEFAAWSDSLPELAEGEKHDDETFIKSSGFNQELWGFNMYKTALWSLYSHGVDPKYSKFISRTD